MEAGYRVFGRQMVVRNDIEADLHDWRFLDVGRNGKYGDKCICDLILREKRNVLVGRGNHNKKIEKNSQRKFPMDIGCLLILKKKSDSY